MDVVFEELPICQPLRAVDHQNSTFAPLPSSIYLLGKAGKTKDCEGSSTLCRSRRRYFGQQMCSAAMLTLWSGCISCAVRSGDPTQHYKKPRQLQERIRQLQEQSRQLQEQSRDVVMQIVFKQAAVK